MNAYALFASEGPFECHDAGGPCKKRVVGGAADIKTGQELGPSLAHQDLTCVYALGPVALDSKPLAVTVPSVYA